MFLFCSHQGGAMTSPDRQQRLAALRDAIADIERKPALSEARQRVALQQNHFPVLPGGLLQEICIDHGRNAAAGLGFALAQASRLVAARRPTIFYICMANDAQELGLPYGPGLLSCGFDPAALILVRASSMGDLLWATEEAVACTAVAAVVADIARPHKLLDFTASRRLSLRAATAGTSLLLLRYGLARPASAAHLRWRLTPSSSGRRRHDDRAPGPLRWSAQLERGTLLGQHRNWLLGWTKNGFATLPARSEPEQPFRAAFPLPVPAQLGDRFPQTA